MFAQNVHWRSSQHVLGFTFVDCFTAEFHKFEYNSCLFPIISIVKLVKIWVLLENSTHVERHRKLSTETLWNYTHYGNFSVIDNFRKWLLCKCFMSLSLIVIQTNIKFLKITVTWTNIWWKLTLITLEIHNYTHYWLFLLYPLKPLFYCISWGLKGSVSHGAVSMMSRCCCKTLVAF